MLAAGEIRAWKPAAAPQRVCRIGTEFGQREPADLDPFDAPDQGFCALPEQFARRAAEYQEPRRGSPTVGQGKPN